MHSSGEDEYHAAASATSEAMLIREVLLFMGLEVRTELLLDSAAARGTCRRECVGTIRHLSTKFLWLQQLVKRGVVTLGACTYLLIHKLRQLRQWKGLVFDRNEKSVNGDKVDVQDETEQQGAAVQSPILCNATEESWTDLGKLVRAIRGTKRVSGPDARCNATSG